jgi:hypothetical protein
MLWRTGGQASWSQAVTKPRNCAVAVCVPLQVETFVRAFEEGEEGTFVRENDRPEYRYLSPVQRWEKYAPLARMIEDLLRHVERLGVRVIRNAQLEDWYELCRSWPVVSLVAHWRSARFRKSDLADAEALAKLAWSDSALRQTLMAMDGEVAMDREVEAGELLPLLNRALEGRLNENSPAAKQAGFLTAQQVQWQLRRLQLEEAAPGMFRRGAAVEFSDGFRTVTDILAGLPERMPAWLDLTVCNSVLLAQVIHDARPGTHCLCNEQSADLPVRMAFYRQVIDCIHRTAKTFPEASFDVRETFRRKG